MSPDSEQLKLTTNLEFTIREGAGLLYSNSQMRTKSYRGHRVELHSEAKRRGEWVARVTIVFTESGKEKRIPIFGRTRMTFASKTEADAYGFELAKLWIDGRLWGTNGNG